MSMSGGAPRLRPAAAIILLPLGLTVIVASACVSSIVGQVAQGRRVEAIGIEVNHLATWRGVAPDVQFTPSGISLDGFGHAYVLDWDHNRVLKFTSEGLLLGKWGSRGGGDGQFYEPFGIAVDAAGNVYVADTMGHRVEKFTSDGRFLGEWGSKGSGDGQFDGGPRSIAVGASGDLFVFDGKRVQRFSAGGSFLGKWGSPGEGDGKFRGGTMTVDGSGNVYVVDGSNGLQKFTSDGHFLGRRYSNFAQFGQPEGIAADPSGNIYVTDGDNQVKKFTSDGRLVGRWGSEGSGDGQLQYPSGIAVDGSGNVYVADVGNNHGDGRIQKFAVR